MSENHFIPMKNALREQYDKYGGIKRQSKNFIILGLRMFQKLIRILNNHTLDLTLCEIDFILEVSQTPMIKNQMMLLEGGIVDDI